MPRTKGATNLANRTADSAAAIMGMPIAFGLTQSVSAPKGREQGGPITNVTFQWILNFLSPVIGILIPAISAPLRGLIEKAMQDWYNQAKASPNPWDNFLVEFIARILGVTLV